MGEVGTRLLTQFQRELFLRLHCQIQHEPDERQPYILLSDEQVLTDEIWRNRTPNKTELSDGRSELRKHRLLSYRKVKTGVYRYFVTNPMTGLPMDKEEAKRVEDEQEQAKPSKKAKQVQQVQQAKPTLPIAKPTSPPIYTHDPQDDDTGWVEDSEIVN